VIITLLFVIGALVVAAVIGVIAELLSGNGAALAAVETAITVAFSALFLVYSSALMLVLHSAASSSA
jgi:hypothetical protein